MKIKTSELTGAALDWAVAKCEGRKDNDFGWWWDNYKPSTNWAHGGPIIEREQINLNKVGRSAKDAMAPHPECWAAHIDGVYCTYGLTPLSAAMRCHVASKLGDEVEIPEELTNEGGES